MSRVCCSGWVNPRAPSRILSTVRLGLSDAYLNFLWYPDAWSRKARQSPAFQGFAKRIGLVDYWKKNRWPDLCSPTPENGPDAFTCR